MSDKEKRVKRRAEERKKARELNASAIKEKKIAAKKMAAGLKRLNKSLTDK